MRLACVFEKESRAAQSDSSRRVRNSKRNQ